MNNILLWFRRYKNNYESVLRVSIAFFILLLFLALLGMLWAMIAVILDFDIKADFMDYTGYTNEKDKPKLIELILWGIVGIGGIITILWGVFKFFWQAASVDEQNTISKKGQVYERFNTAIEHVGNENNVLARIAAFNEFYHTAEIEPDLRKTIFDLLCAHLRQTTKHEDYKNNLKPTEEVQSLLDILFKPKNKGVLIFSGLEANLAEARLQGANLQEANLQEANLQGVNLQSANLRYANLQEANLQEAKMQEVHLQEANLQEANLQSAHLRYAKMKGANLQNANLQEAKMQGAYLRDTNLQEANLRYAKMQESDLQEANLRYANLQEAKMQGAYLRDTNLQEANLQGVDMQKAELQGADLQGAQINRETTVMPDNWTDVVKLYDNKEGQKRPMVVVMNSKEEVEGRY